MKLALALLLTLATPALAWNEPDSISGVQWGATQEDLRVQLQRAGETVRCDSPEMCVSLGVSFGSVPSTSVYLPEGRQTRDGHHYVQARRVSEAARRLR